MQSAVYGLKNIGGFGSVHGAPNLPADFSKTFSSWLVPSNGIHLHAVVGGNGPALLLAGGWPQNWFAWRYLMPTLADHFTVVAVDNRGAGLSDKPLEGYDTDNHGRDLLDLMSELGHETFSMVGYDLGMWAGFAMAYQAPERITRLALGEAIIPGVSPSPPLLSIDRRLSDFLWHFNFNRALGVNEELVRGREEIYFGEQFASKAGTRSAMPTYARNFYIKQLTHPDSLRGSFGYYRALDISILQNMNRLQNNGKITLPVLAFAGELACGDSVEKEVSLFASNMQSTIIAGSGHYPAEEKPRETLAMLLEFLLE